MAATGTDLILIERGGELYKATAAEIAALAPIGVHPIPPGAAAGEFVTNAVAALAMGTVAGAANRLDLMPFIPTETITVDRLSLEVTTGVASAQARIGIYGSTATGAPGDLLTGQGTLLDCATTGEKASTISGGITLNAGTPYWLGVHMSSTATLRALAVGGMMPLGIPATGTGLFTLRRASPAFASNLPTTAPASTLTSAVGPRMALRLA